MTLTPPPPPQQAPIRQFARDAAALNISLATVMLGSLYWNPAIWIDDYPPDIRAAYGPLDEKGKRQKRIFALPILLIGFAGPILSTLRLKRRHGGRISFAAAYAHIFGLILSFWLFDLTVLDWLIFVTITPDIAVLPGTEGMAGYDDYAFHLREHMRALPMLAAGAFILALPAYAIPVRPAPAS